MEDSESRGDNPVCIGSDGYVSTAILRVFSDIL